MNNSLACNLAFAAHSSRRGRVGGGGAPARATDTDAEWKRRLAIKFLDYYCGNVAVLDVLMADICARGAQQFIYSLPHCLQVKNTILRNLPSARPLIERRERRGKVANVCWGQRKRWNASAGEEINGNKLQAIKVKLKWQNIMRYFIIQFEVNKELLSRSPFVKCTECVCVCLDGASN